MNGELQTVLELGWNERLNVAPQDMSFMEKHTAGFEHRKTFEIEPLLKWHRPAELIWLSTQPNFPDYMPDGGLTRSWLVEFAKDFERLSNQRNDLSDQVHDLQVSLAKQLTRKSLWQKIQSIFQN